MGRQNCSLPRSLQHPLVTKDVWSHSRTSLPIMLSTPRSLDRFFFFSYLCNKGRKKMFCMMLSTSKSPITPLRIEAKQPEPSKNAIFCYILSTNWSINWSTIFGNLFGIFFRKLQLPIYVHRKK